MVDILTTIILTTLAIWVAGPEEFVRPKGGQAEVVQQQEVATVAGPVLLRAHGYGAVTDGPGLSGPQRHLMAMRASRLDAMRAMAEQVHGMHIKGSSSLSAMGIGSDHFRAYVEGQLQGVEVLSVTPMPDGVFETEVQLVLPGEVVRCMTQPTPECVGMQAEQLAMQQDSMSGRGGVPQIYDSGAPHVADF
ncbi:MAG: LPP20 family lipoprotein [Chromatiales bacterium]|jgi:hypothetical protein|nr:LPP20 family lipoprotein [Chromatiales bacterium]MDX9767006.1 LPP20 family lipoprotein [Ectothiorhodospiraceae bacterium]